MKKKLTNAQRMVLLLAQKNQVFSRQPSSIRKPTFWIGGRKDVIERMMSCGLLQYRPRAASDYSPIQRVMVTEKGQMALHTGEYDG